MAVSAVRQATSACGIPQSRLLRRSAEDGLPTVAPNGLFERVHRRLALNPGQAMVDNLRMDHGAEVGGPDRDRTGDLLNAIQARSQLRHRPTRRERLSIIPDRPGGPRLAEKAGDSDLRPPARRGGWSGSPRRSGPVGQREQRDGRPPLDAPRTAYGTNRTMKPANA